MGVNRARPSAPSLPVPVLRDAVAREAARVSLRQAAREVGTSPNGLRNFLNGAAPRVLTRVKLEEWLARRTTPSRPPAVGQLVRLVHAMATDLTPPQAIDFARKIAAALEAAYEERRLAPPKWVRELARRAARSASRDSQSVA